MGSIETFIAPDAITATGRNEPVPTGLQITALGRKAENLPLTNWVPSQFLGDRRLRHRSGSKLRLPARNVAVKPAEFFEYDRQIRMRRYMRKLCLSGGHGFSHSFKGLSEWPLNSLCFSDRERPWMPLMCPGFGPQSTGSQTGNYFRSRPEAVIRMIPKCRNGGERTRSGSNLGRKTR
jgi:hypothetical protein